MTVDDSVPTILILDADTLARRALVRCLRASRFEVLTAARATDALALIESVPLGLVIASIEAGPPADVVATLAEIRARQPSCGRVLVADAVVCSEVTEAALAGACHVVLQRPFAISDALAYVDASRAATLRERRATATSPRIAG